MPVEKRPLPTLIHNNNNNNNHITNSATVVDLNKKNEEEEDDRENFTVFMQNRPIDELKGIAEQIEHKLNIEQQQHQRQQDQMSNRDIRTMDWNDDDPTFTGNSTNVATSSTTSSSTNNNSSNNSSSTLAQRQLLQQWINNPRGRSCNYIADFHPSQFGDVDGFCNAHGLGIYQAEDSRAHAVSHTGMDGKRIRVPQKLTLKFLKMLSYDAQYSTKSNKFCEIIDPRRFRMFIDCDIQTDATVDESMVLRYAKPIQATISKFFKRDFRMVVCVSVVSNLKTDDGVAYNKFGIHFVWPTVIVDLLKAKTLANAVIADLEQLYPDIPYPGNPISDQIDTNVYKNAGGGLRMIYNSKMKKCPACNGHKDRKKHCVYCREKGMIEEGRPYKPIFVLDDHGQKDAAETERIVYDVDYAFLNTYLRVGRSFALRADFEPPAYTPMTLVDRQDLELMGFHPDQVVAPEELEAKRAALLSSKTTSTNTTSNVNVSGDGSVPLEQEEYMETETTRNQTQQDQKERVNQYWDQTQAVLSRLDRNGQLLPDGMIQKRPLFLLEGVAPCSSSSSSSSTEGKHSSKNVRRQLEETYGPLANLSRFKDSRQTIDELKRNKGGLQFVEPDPALFNALAQFISSWRKEWTDITVRAIAMQPKSKDPYSMLFVEGYNAHYCMNKHEYHATATIYFYVNANGEIHQRCCSKKKQIRSEAYICKEYCSEGTTLPPYLSKLLNAVTRKTVKLLVNISSQDQIAISRQQEDIVMQFRKNTGFEPTSDKIARLNMLTELAYLCDKQIEQGKVDYKPPAPAKRIGVGSKKTAVKKATTTTSSNSIKKKAKVE